MSDGLGVRRFVAFYWTLPVPWAGFDDLTDDVDEAARRSLTIRYQRTLARRYVHDCRGEIVFERAFLELRSDAGTEHAAREIEALARSCHALQAKLLWIDFAAAMQWRSHYRIREAIADAGVLSEPIPAEPIVVEGKMLDPRQHFAAWQGKTELHNLQTKERSEIGLADALVHIPAQWGRNRKIAEYLNARRIPTKTGKAWTDENVKKAVTEIESDEGASSLASAPLVRERTGHAG